MCEQSVSRGWDRKGLMCVCVCVCVCVCECVCVFVFVCLCVCSLLEIFNTTPSPDSCLLPFLSMLRIEYQHRHGFDVSLICR